MVARWHSWHWSPGQVSPPLQPASNSVSFPATSQHLDKPDPFQPSQYVLRQASAHLGTPTPTPLPPPKQAFSLGHDFFRGGEQNWVVETFFSFLGFFFLQTNFAFFGLFFLPPHPPLFCVLSSPFPIHNLPRPPSFPTKLSFFLCFVFPVLGPLTKKRDEATLNPPDTGRFKNPAAACGC